MVTCMDVNNLKLDGVELVAGEEGLHRIVSWSYLVQTRPYDEHMNQGNFALIVVDYVRFDFDEVRRTMEELNDLGISGLAISVVDDKEFIPQDIIDRAEELALPLFLCGGKGLLSWISPRVSESLFWRRVLSTSGLVIISTTCSSVMM